MRHYYREHNLRISEEENQIIISFFLFKIEKSDIFLPPKIVNSRNWRNLKFV